MADKALKDRAYVRAFYPAMIPGSEFSRAAAASLLAAILWGLWWIPVRYLEGFGIHAAGAALLLSAAGLVLALVWVGVARISLALPRRALLGTTAIGIALLFYSVAVGETGIVRAVLLFYLAPAWSKIIECLFFGAKWGLAATMAVCAALLGAYLVLGADVRFETLGPGEIYAVAGGLVWSIGTALVFSAPARDAVPLTVATLAALLFASAVFVLADPTGFAPEQPIALGGVALLLGLFYILPLHWLTLWSASRLPPAIMTFLLTAEILSGVISGAVLLDEPFGALQVAGAALILAGALTELAPNLRRKSV